MSTQSGITSSAELLDAFKGLGNNSLVVTINGDSTQLVPHEHQAHGSDLSQIFSSLNTYFTNHHPESAYIILPEANGYAFISFIPGEAKVRQKMLYASTRDTLLQQLGTGHFLKSHNFNWLELDELTWDNYTRETTATPQSAVLLELEKLLENINSVQSLSLANKKELPSMYKHSGLLLFAVEALLDHEFESFDSNKLVVFGIDVDREVVVLTASTHVDLDALVAQLQKTSADKPQFAVYSYDEGKLAFIHSYPPTSKVKERLVYAANMQQLISYIKTKTSASVTRTFSVNYLDELELSELRPTEAPAPVVTGLKFTKPKGPRRR